MLEHLSILCLKGDTAMTNIYQPYTYLIGWSFQNLYYYGCEYGSKVKVANPQNLWSNYFTSSKYVQEAREFYGEPDIIQIRRVFDDETSCREWEKRVLSKMNVLHDEKWLNRNVVGSIKMTEEIRQKISEAHKGMKHSEESKMKMSAHQRGKKKNTPISDETKRKISRSLTGRKLTKEHSRKISEGNKRHQASL